MQREWAVAASTVRGQDKACVVHACVVQTRTTAAQLQVSSVEGQRRAGRTKGAQCAGELLNQQLLLSAGQNFSGGAAAPAPALPPALCHAEPPPSLLQRLPLQAPQAPPGRCQRARVCRAPCCCCRRR